MESRSTAPTTGTSSPLAITPPLVPGGVADAGQIPFGSVLQGICSWGRRGCCQNASEQGQFATFGFVAQIRSVNIQMKSLSHYGSRQNRCIVSAVFEVKKKFRFDNCGNRELDEARSRYVERFSEKG